jgi:hypothetical protein
MTYMRHLDVILPLFEQNYYLKINYVLAEDFSQFLIAATSLTH